MGEVPRHLFVPQADIRESYADLPVIVQRAADETPISSASQPTMVAKMLEQLDVAPGDSVLEIGTGTGYNAALLASLAGHSGTVVTIEIEPQLVAKAAQTLTEVIAQHVEVITGDGKLGSPIHAPYHRIIVTAGALDVSAHWIAQLSDGGRLVVPLVDRLGIGSVVTFDKVGGELVRRAHTQCGFLVLRDGAEGTD
jgi:protein-L-isoaspartate(D-aspartate) O-methyltransferase